MKESSKSILEVGKGQILEKADYELSKVLANINDPNTSDKTKRKITISLTLQPVNGRESVLMNCSVKSSLAPTNPTEILLSNSIRTNKDGETFNVLQEVSKNARGQLNLNGDIFEPETFLIGYGSNELLNKEQVQKDGGEKNV